MIRFTPVRLEDRTTVERYTRTSTVTNCDLAFANIYCWNDLYHSEWAEVEGFLVIRFRIDGDPRTGYMQPVGAGDFRPILPLLEAEAHRRGEPLRLFGLDEEAAALLKGGEAGPFACIAERDYADYLYSAEALRTLRGKGYQPKRNHFNRFISEYPDYRYEPLTPDRFAECLTLERLWRSRHEANDSELCAEQRAMQRGFEHFAELGLRGGCLYVGDRIVAFTYGSAVNAETFDIHVEKADTRYDGAFTAINRLFAEHLPDTFKQINREEDLGLPGLRQAKLSYQPIRIAPKYTALRLTPEAAACKRLWLQAFGSTPDEAEAADRFFVHYYDRQRMIAATAAGNGGNEPSLIGMLHLLPFRCESGRACYLYAVATDPRHRRQGIASQLLRAALQRITDEGYDLALLIPDPAQPWLTGFYARFGFTGSLPVTFTAPDGFDFGTGSPALDRAMVRPLHPQQPLPASLTCHYDPKPMLPAQVL